MNTLLEKWQQDLGYFQPDVLLQYTDYDWETYRRAYEHFFGVDIGQGGPHGCHLRSRDSVPTIEGADEHELANALLTHTHELQHYYQITSTAFGYFRYFLESLCWDHMREFARRLLTPMTSNYKEIGYPLITKAKTVAGAFGGHFQELIEYGEVVGNVHLTLLRLFDQPNLTVDGLLFCWNGATGLLDSAERREGDTIEFVHLSSKLPSSTAANPGGLTLRGMLESAAHCEEMRLLGALPISDDTKVEIFHGAHFREYRQVWDRLDSVVDSPSKLGIISRVVAIALQTSLTSMHLGEGTSTPLLLEDTSPTFRAHRIIEALKNGDIAPPEIVLDPPGPDMVCDHFGWPHVCRIMENFLRTPTYPGVAQGLDFINGQHRSFCKLAISSPMRPIWMGDLGNSSDQTELEFAKAYLPPFSSFRDRVVLQADVHSVVRMAPPLLTTSAVKELLFGDALDETRGWLARIGGAFQQLSPDLGRAFLEEVWPETFEHSFGAQWEQMP